MRPGLALSLVVLLAGCLAVEPRAGAPSPSHSPSPTVEPTEVPTGPPSPSADATSSPEPSAELTPSPTPDPAELSLEVDSCNGGVVLHWSPSRHPDFHHYIGLRSPERDVATQFPPIAPAVDWGDLYATDPFVTSGFDATLVPSDTEWHYRVVAYDAAGRVIGSTPVQSGRIHPHADLGALEVTALDEGRARLAWGAFDGLDGCFSSYRVLYGTAGVASTVLTTVSDAERTEIETAALRPGVSYTLRVQAVRTTTLGFFVVGETSPAFYTAPVGEP